MLHHSPALLLATILATATLPSIGAVVSADDNVTVEIFLAKEHVPNDLKKGDKVRVLRVNSKTATSTGIVSYSTGVVAADAIVASVKAEEKPPTPEQAFKVEVNVTKTQAAAIERVKKQLVTVHETNGNGTVETKKVPVTMRLERMK